MSNLCFHILVEVRKHEVAFRYSSPLGIMCQSEFAKIPDKNVIHLSPPDTMHDIMEGRQIKVIGKALQVN